MWISKVVSLFSHQPNSVQFSWYLKSTYKLINKYNLLWSSVKHWYIIISHASSVSLDA